MCVMRIQGIINNVTLNGVTLTNWEMNLLPLDRKKLPNSLRQLKYKRAKRLTKAVASSKGSMTFWQGDFKACVDGTPRDTFLDMSGWNKGVAFINGFNLGRYWPDMGPQVTLYVPAPILTTNCSDTNTLILFEQEKPQNTCLQKQEAKCHVEFVKEPKINQPVPIA